MAVERESLYLYSTTALSNGSADPQVNFAENQLPSTVNNSARSVMAGVARWLKDNNGSLTTGGSANAYTLTINGTQTGPANGHIYSFKASFSNTGATTLTITNADATAFAAKFIRVITAAGEAALSANMIRSGGHYVVQYDSAAASAAGAYILLNPTLQTVVAIRVQRFTANGTYTPDAALIYAIIRCRGGGGGGGGATSSGATRIGCGGGGGQGSLAVKVASAATIGSSQTVTVGAAANGGSAGNNAGTAGNDTSVGTLCVGKGGGAGAGGPSFSLAAGGAGGVAGTGDTFEVGFPGMVAAGCDTASGIQIPAAGGGYGGGASVTGFSTTTGNNAVANSGGGGGGGQAANSGNAAGGNGGSGEVVIYEFCYA